MSFSKFVRVALASSTLALAITAAPSADAANDVFLSLSGIPGEATDEGFAGQIGINSFTLGLSTDPAAASGSSRTANMGTPKAQVDTVSVSKPLDKSSVKLFESALTGKRIPTAVLSTRKLGQRQPYYKVTLTDVAITSIKVAEGQGITESVTFSFSKIELEYFAQDPKGQLSSAGKVSWDVKLGALK